ncbi:hypothetical protein [Streptomyces sp. NPDC005970]|uniref:hypothetical protein n=1 Tax=unclassified Streptomyces TaxID=2593676 RepID=UPI0033C7E7EC
MADNLVLTHLKRHVEKTGKIMSHRTTLRHARNAAAAVVIAIAAFGLTACQGSDTEASPSSSTSASAKPSGTPKKPGIKCTDLVNYGEDSRSNAEINSIGEDTGYCPEPNKDMAPSGTPKKPGIKCTDLVNYGEDSRSNAEINSIGEDTGYCPPVQQ